MKAIVQERFGSPDGLALRDIDKPEIGADQGHLVLIYGAGGGVGAFAMQIAKAFGARVTGVITTENLDLVRSLGADDVVDYRAEDFTARGEQYDVLVDIGSDRSWSELRRLLKPNGKALLVGAPQGTWAMLGRFVKVGRSNAQGPRSLFSPGLTPKISAL